MTDIQSLQNEIKMKNDQIHSLEAKITELQNLCNNNVIISIFSK